MKTCPLGIKGLAKLEEAQIEVLLPLSSLNTSGNAFENLDNKLGPKKKPG